MRTKITKAPCRKRTGTAVPRAEKMVTWWQQITKFQVKDVNLETIIDTLSWYRIWLPNGFNLIRAKQKLLRKQKRVCKTSWSRRGNQKSFTLAIPVYVNTSPFRNKWDCWESGAQDKTGNFCCTVAIRSGRKMVGGFHGMLYLSAKHSRYLVWWGDNIREAIWRTSMDPGLSVQKQKLRKKPREACKSSWNPRGNQKSFTLTIPWNSAKLVKISPGIIARLHHTDQRLMVLRKEQCAE